MASSSLRTKEGIYTVLVVSLEHISQNGKQRASRVSLFTGPSIHIATATNRTMSNVGAWTSSGHTTGLASSLLPTLPVSHSSVSTTGLPEHTCPASLPWSQLGPYTEAVHSMLDNAQDIKGEQVDVQELCKLASRLCHTLQNENPNETEGEFSTEGWYVRFCRFCAQVDPVMRGISLGLVLTVSWLNLSSPDIVRGRAGTEFDAEILGQMKGLGYQEMADRYHEVATRVVQRHGYTVLDTGTNQRGGRWLFAEKRFGAKPLLLYHRGPLVNE